MKNKQRTATDPVTAMSQQHEKTNGMEEHCRLKETRILTTEPVWDLFSLNESTINAKQNQKKCTSV